MNTEGQVGPQLLNDGASQNFRQGRTGEQIVSDGHSRYQEMTVRNNVYTANTKSSTVTATTDIAPLPANTGVPQLGIYNPVGSGKNLVILKAGVSTISGTPGGPFYFDVIPPNAGITASGTNAINNFTFQQTGSVAKVFAHTAITGSVAAITLRPLGGPAAVAAGAGNYQVDEEVAGAIIIPQGGFLGISAHAVGTSHVISAYITWEEINA